MSAINESLHSLLTCLTQSVLMAFLCTVIYLLGITKEENEVESFLAMHFCFSSGCVVAPSCQYLEWRGGGEVGGRGAKLHVANLRKTKKRSSVVR